MVKCDELISTTENLTIGEVSYKPMSLCPGSTVYLFLSDMIKFGSCEFIFFIQ
jgi:hypothetical protein